MRREDFKRLTGWVDYDRHLLPLLDKPQQIKYFRKRLNITLIMPLREMYKNLKSSRRDSSNILCFGTCICCALEALGKFYTGKTGRKESAERFKAFVKKYMNPKYKKARFKRKLYADILWDSFRNGLAHGFTIKDGGFEHHSSYFQVKIIGGKHQLEIDPTYFYKDFINAAGEYAGQLVKAKESDQLYIKFENTFTKIFIKGL